MASVVCNLVTVRRGAGRTAARMERRTILLGPHCRRGLLLLLCVGAAVPAQCHANSPQQLLDEAVGEYRAALDCTDREQRLAKFQRAELLFSGLIQGKPGGGVRPIHNADLYVNLGNAAMGAERLGAAILAYRRALALDPDHHRALQNLRHARTLLPEWVPRPSEGGLLDNFFAWRTRLSASEIQLMAAGIFLVSSVLIACAIRWRQQTLRNLAMIPAVCWLMLLALAFFGGASDGGDAAVVVVPEVVARSADSAGAPARLPQPVPSGTELDVMETRDDWVRVRLFDGRDAWLPESAVQRVKWDDE